MNGFLVSFALVLIISVVIGLVTRWLRSIQLAEQHRQAEARAAQRNRATMDETDNRRSQRSPSTDMERFLEEINKLRNRSAGPAGSSSLPPVARPVATPVARPVSPLGADPIPVVEPTRKPSAVSLDQILPSSPPVVTAPIKLDSLPGVTYSPTLLSMTTSKPVPVAKPLPALPTLVSKLSVESVQPDRAPKSDLTNEFLKIIKGGNGLALAMIMHEVFGPPKCKQQG